MGTPNHYKLYSLDAGDHIVSALWIEADGDAEALAKAAELGDEHGCELWLRARKVAAIPAKSSRQS